MKRKLAVVAFVICILLFVPLFGFRLYRFNDSFYFSHIGMVENSTYLKNNVIGYLCGVEDLDSSYFSLREITHMEDVKFLFGLFDVIFWLALLFAVVLGIYLYKEGLFLGLRYSGCAIFVSLLCALVIDFNFLFTLFHKILFRNNFWMLDSGSTLLKLFPVEFFMSFFAYISIFSLIFAVIFVILSFAKVTTGQWKDL